MSRAAVYKALYQDTGLNALGLTRDEIFVNYSMEETPGSRDKRFLILRWEEQRFSPALSRGPHRLTVWAHCPIQLGTDFTELDKILARVKVVLTSMEQVAGTDGQIVTAIRATGAGGDLRDNGYNTITKNSAFEVLFRAA